MARRGRGAWRPAIRLPDGAASRVLPSPPLPRAAAAATSGSTGPTSGARVQRRGCSRTAFLEAFLVGLGGRGHRAPRRTRLGPRRLDVLGLDSCRDRVGPGALAATGGGGRGPGTVHPRQGLLPLHQVST